MAKYIVVHPVGKELTLEAVNLPVLLSGRLLQLMLIALKHVIYVRKGKHTVNGMQKTLILYAKSWQKQHHKCRQMAFTK